jgi:hypothetical protein
MKSTLHLIPGIVALIVIVWLFGGCHDELLSNSDEIVGSGTLVTRSISLSQFSGVQLTGIGEVYVTQDTVQSIRVESDDNIIDRLSLEVHGSNLIIGIQKGSYSHATIRIYVSMRSVELLELTGAGNFAAVGPLDANALTCRIVGAGSVTLSGRASSETIMLEGAGSIYAFELESSHCSVLLTGAGSAEVTVTQHLEATISGVGNVTYAGDPPEVVSHLSGLGSIHRK